MKISELAPIAAANRNIRLPLSIAGQNMSITLGQIIDAASRGIVPFDSIESRTASVTYVAGSSSASLGGVIFDAVTSKFYRATFQQSGAASIATYYQNFDTRDDYYGSDGGVRTDCLFAASDGRLYMFSGSTLISSGLTEAQAKQIRLSTPVEVESEEEMEQLIEAGECEAGQIYFLAEEE